MIYIKLLKYNYIIYINTQLLCDFKNFKIYMVGCNFINAVLKLSRKFWDDSGNLLKDLNISF